MVVIGAGQKEKPIKARTIATITLLGSRIMKK